MQDETGYGCWEAELHRLEGIALLGLNRLDEGQRALETALRVALSQQAKAFELRAAMSIARPAVAEANKRGWQLNIAVVDSGARRRFSKISCRRAAACAPSMRTKVTAIWLVQFVGREIRVPDYIESVGQPLPHAHELRRSGWKDAIG